MQDEGAEIERPSVVISVIILNYNGKRYLERCLSTLLAQTRRDIEVIMVDNGSTDGSIDYLECQFPEVRIVKNEKNLGFAGGVNSGIRVAKGDCILTLNNDTQVDKDFVKCLSEAMDSDEKVGMCASKMLFCDGSINSAGICLSQSGAAWGRGMSELDLGQYDEMKDVFGPCAGAALYRRAMLDEIGLFDEDFFMYMEDVDLAFRARLAGWRCLYVPDAKVYHVHGGTAGFGSDFSVYYGNRNVLWYVIKDLPIVLLIYYIPWILGRNLAVIPYYALKGKGRTILRSKFDALKGVPLMLRKRKGIVRKVPAKEISKYIMRWSDVREP